MNLIEYTSSIQIVLIYKGAKLRVYPTEAQIVILDDWDDALRWLWNIALEQRLLGLARPKCERRYPTAFDQINELTELRALLPWLAAVPRNICTQLLVELDLAWQRCFKKLARAPGWKCKGRDFLSFCTVEPSRWHITNDFLRFPKLGPMRIVVHRPLEGKPKGCTIKRDGDQWFACIVCEVKVEDPVPRTEPVVGIDRGVVLLIADSDGKKIENPSHYKKSHARLARAQRNVARKEKGSNTSATTTLRTPLREPRRSKVPAERSRSRGTTSPRSPD